MKYLALLLVFSVCMSCGADEFEQVTENMKSAGVEAAEEVLEMDASAFEVRIQPDAEDEDLDNYIRREKVILIKNNNVYRLCMDGVRFATVVVNKDWSPHIIIEKNLDFGIFVTSVGDGMLELSAMGTDAEFLEIYTITKEWVKPVSSEQYLEHFAAAKGSQAAFKSLGESLMESTEETVETE